MASPLVSLTTDFGLTDPSVGICKGVILSIAPDARIVDLSHGIPRHSVIEGAGLLASALPYMPVGIHVAVVDPGVGTARRAMAIRTGRGDFLVGPDNGLLVPAAEVLGGAVAGHELVDPRYRLSPVSRTFHGRDIFSPAAGHLAAGVALADMGPAVDPASLVRLDLPPAVADSGALRAIVVAIDSFGSAQLLAGQTDLERAIGPVHPGDRLRIEVRTAGRADNPSGADDAGRIAGATWRLAYGEAAEGELVVLVDSYGRLAVAVNRGSAADRLAVGTGVLLRIGRA
jgi:S-adenosylmethionine hydrolase